MVTTVESERLIELVKKNSCLYDTNHPHYSSSAKKRQLWIDIGKEMKMSAFECKSRWNNMRYTYRKSISRRSAGDKVCRYKYSKQMSFLKKIFKFDTNVEDEKPYDEDIENSPALSDVPVDDGTDDKNNDVETENEEDKNSDSLKFPDEIEIDYPEFRKNIEEVNPLNREIHPVDTFLARVAPTLKKLSTNDLNLAKLEIFQIIQKYKMKSIKELKQKISLNDGSMGSKGHLSDGERLDF